MDIIRQGLTEAFASLPSPEDRIQLLRNAIGELEARLEKLEAA